MSSDIYYDESGADRSDDNSSDEEYFIVNPANRQKKKQAKSHQQKNKKSFDESPSKQSSYSRGCAPGRLPSHGTSWTADEEKRFEEGIERYGKGKWVPISKHIVTRNALQVKNHARNYFRKIEEGYQPTSPVKKKTKRTTKKKSSRSTARSMAMLDDEKNDDLSESIAAESMVMMMQPAGHDSETEEEEDLDDRLKQLVEFDHNNDQVNSETSSAGEIKVNGHHPIISGLDQLVSAAKETQFKRGCLSSLMKERERLIAALPTPTQPFVILDDNEISEQEKLYNKEFFMENSSKTPERYIRIRNFCLATWQKQNPTFVSKTAIRMGLKDCGDVNAIGRVHEYLEKIGAINFGASVKTTPKKSKKKPKSKADNNISPKKETPDDYAVEGADIVKEKLLAKRKREKPSPTLSAIRYYERPKRKCAKPNPDESAPFPTINCRQYHPPHTPPFHVTIDASCLILIDIHAHLASGKVTGLLGGSFDADKKLLAINTAVLSQNNTETIYKCEMDALAETLTKDAINNMNLSVVGLYHSHNSFSPNPSLFDIEHQTKNQNLFQNANGDEPFISIIVCPYDQKHPSHCSQFNFVHICKEWTPDFNNRLPCSLPHEVVFTTGAQKLVDMVDTLLTNFQLEASRVDLDEEFMDTTKLEKLIKSITGHLASVGEKEEILTNLRQLLVDKCCST